MAAFCCVPFACSCHKQPICPSASVCPLCVPTTAFAQMQGPLQEVAKLRWPGTAQPAPLCTFRTVDDHRESHFCFNERAKISLPTLRLGVGAGAGDQGMFGCQAPGFTSPHAPPVRCPWLVMLVLLVLLVLCGSMNDVCGCCCCVAMDKVTNSRPNRSARDFHPPESGRFHEMPLPGKCDMKRMKIAGEPAPRIHSFPFHSYSNQHRLGP